MRGVRLLYDGFGGAGGCTKFGALSALPELPDWGLLSSRRPKDCP